MEEVTGQGQSALPWVHAGIRVTIQKVTQTRLLSFSPVCLLQSQRGSGSLGPATKGASGALSQFWGVSVACFIVHQGGESWKGVYGAGIEAVRRTLSLFTVWTQLIFGWNCVCYILPQVPGEAGLQDTEIFLAVMKRLFILTWLPEVCFAAAHTHNNWSGGKKTEVTFWQCHTALSRTLFAPFSPVLFLRSLSLSWHVCTFPFLERRRTMTGKSGAFMKKWSNRSEQKGRG